MRKIHINKISESVKKDFLKANVELPNPVVKKINDAYKISKGKSKRALNTILLNCEIAKNEKLPLCQDTGMAEVFAFIGQDVFIDFRGSKYNDFQQAINQSVSDAYKEGYFRKSVVTPITRKNNKKNIPAIIHTEIVKGNKIELYVVPKGFGCENMSTLKMFNPTVSIDKIMDFIVDRVKTAGPNPCPPIFLGIGIGGTSEKAILLAKMAQIGIKRNCEDKKIISKMEEGLLKRINNLKIGPLGYGGNPSAFAININTYPTHIAGLPAAVTFSCWCNRYRKIVIS